MPDGSSKAFYRSTGTSDPSKAAENKGRWFPFEGFTTGAKQPLGSTFDNNYNAARLAKTYHNRLEGQAEAMSGSKFDDASRWIDKYIDAMGGDDVVFKDARVIKTGGNPKAKGMTTAEERKVMGRVNRFLNELGAIDFGGDVYKFNEYGERRRLYGFDYSPESEVRALEAQGLSAQADYLRKKFGLGESVDGGSVTDLFPQRNTLERAAKIGYDVPDWLKGASGSELLDRPVGVPKDFNDPSFIRMIENPALGYDSDYLYQLNQYATTRRNVLKRDYDEELRKAFEDYPDNIYVGNINNADKIKLQLEQFSRGYDESANSMSGQYLIRFARKVDGVQVDLTPIESSVGLSTQIVGFANKLEGSLLDDLTTPEFMRNPVLQNIKIGFDAVVKEFPEGSRREAFRALEAMFDDYQDLDKARQLMPVGFSDDHNKKRFLNKFMNDYFKLDAPKKK